jgi:hypothetical protein
MVAKTIVQSHVSSYSVACCCSSSCCGSIAIAIVGHPVKFAAAGSRFVFLTAVVCGRPR